jgi:hypothetical protein
MTSAEHERRTIAALVILAIVAASAIVWKASRSPDRPLEPVAFTESRTQER